jgi:hypothetical protein
MLNLGLCCTCVVTTQLDAGTHVQKPWKMSDKLYERTEFGHDAVGATQEGWTA